MLKRHPPNENHEMLPYYEGVYELTQNIIEFVSAEEILMKEDYKMVAQRRLERVFKMMMDCKSYTKNEDIPENKEIFLYAFKHVKTEKVDNYTLIGFDSDELFENGNLFNFCSNKFINEEIENRDFRLTG